jgi:toxin ParE1/3/4
VKAQDEGWTVRLGETARSDFRRIIGWTTERFGEKQSRAYAATLSAALEALTAGPAIAGVKARQDIGRGLYTLHAARAGRRGRHVIIFRIAGNPTRKIIDIVRILHDAIDLPRHVPANER